jgi:tRNA threonylcarbamoyladenosine biosynthesis protein TsaE
LRLCAFAPLRGKKNVREIRSTSAEETFNVGKHLGTLLNSGDLVAFSGDLGAGKTCCIQGIAAGLGVQDITLVNSPTFTLIQEYQGRLPIYHFDVYRLSHEDDLYDLGYEEYFYGDGVTLIEWAERITAFLPAEHIAVNLHIESEHERRILLRVFGKHHEQLFDRLVSTMES